jgi:hypothetical protein
MKKTKRLKMTKQMKLTASQIRHFDELVADRRASELTLQIALQYHTNNSNRILKEEKELWDSLIEQYDLDPEIKWTLKMVEGALVVVEKEEA